MSYYIIAGAVVVVAVLTVAYFALSGPKKIKLNPRGTVQFPLISKRDEIPPEKGMHTMVFRFGLPSKDAVLELPIGQHVSVYKDAMTSRQYTPTTSEDTKGYFELMIKIYNDGQLGNYLKNLPLNTMVKFKGPQGHLVYNGNGSFTIKRRTTSGAETKTQQVSHIGMIAGGTGITPMLQIVRYVSRRPTDTTKMSLIFANRTEGDIMCRAELEQAAESNPNFKLHLQLDRAPNSQWRGGVGFVTDQVVQSVLPAPAKGVLILVCGPPPMVDIMRGILTKLGYSDDMIFVY